MADRRALVPIPGAARLANTRREGPRRAGGRGSVPPRMIVSLGGEPQRFCKRKGLPGADEAS